MQPQIAELSTRDPDFVERLDVLLTRGSELDATVERKAREIVDDVRKSGDAALLQYARDLDGSTAESAAQLEVSEPGWTEACARVDGQCADAIEMAASRIREFHERQIERSWQRTDDSGSTFGQRVTPIKRIGIYAPGGIAAYPSSVLMSAIPARVAGVEHIVLSSPGADGAVNDAVLLAAKVAGVDRVFGIGGAQAIAALAFGTETVPKTDKIVGPGNAWVSAAKRLVFGHVGIDLIAGPSEVVVVCDDAADPRWAAMDLFAQAEHSHDAQSILISDSKRMIERVRREMSEILPGMERREIIAQALERQGALLHVSHAGEIPEIVDRIAPEHLELMVADPAALAEAISNAGAIFFGSYSAEVLGDYCAGPSHVLPTSGAARFSSPLGVYDFIKRTSIIDCSAQGANELAKIASVIAREERLTAHMRSAQLRQQSP